MTNSSSKRAKRERLALRLTMTAAVVSGLLWVVSLVLSDPPGSLDGLRGAVFLLLMVGGVAMGALYLWGRFGERAD